MIGSYCSNPFPYDLKKVTTRQTLSGIAGASPYDIALFTVTGVVCIQICYGIVSTDLGANVTTVYLDLWDATLSTVLTKATGTTMSAAQVGSLITRNATAGTAIGFSDALTGYLQDIGFQPFTVGKKEGATTQIRMHYATTDNPTSGVIDWVLTYIPLSRDGLLVAI